MLSRRYLWHRWVCSYCRHLRWLAKQNGFRLTYILHIPPGGIPHA
jgi:hypothetical protein